MTESRKNAGQGHHYSDAFRRKAVSLLTTTQASAADVSAELGIGVSTLWRWHKELGAAESMTDAPTYDALIAEVHRLKTENDFLKKGLELLRLTPSDWYPVIAILEVAWLMRYMCTVLTMSRSKYYAWRQQGDTSRRVREDRRLEVLIRSIHAEWDGILGCRRMRDVLHTHHGERIGTRRL